MEEPKRKRYKLHLSANYDPAMVSYSTNRRWNLRSKSFNQKVKNYLQNRNRGYPSNIFEIQKHSKVNNFQSPCEHEYIVNTPDTQRKIIDNVHEAEDDNWATDDELMEIDEVEVTANVPSKCQSTTHESNTKQKSKKKKIFDSNDRIMFKESNITINDVITMITGFTLRFGIPNEGRKKLMEMFKLCAGSTFNHISISNYHYDKMFEIPKKTVMAHYFCSKCTKVIYTSWKESVEHNKILCKQCHTITHINFMNDQYFLTIDLEYQIKEVLNMKEVRSAIKESFTRNYNISPGISDIYDGELFKKFYGSNEKLLHLNFNTDGAPIFKKSKRSMWPLQIIINNLPPKLRFENTIIIGLMIVRKEPTPALMNLFLESFKNQINKLYTNGFYFDLNENGTEDIIKIAVSNCSVDSVARAVCQNRYQHNGFYACSYCYIRGDYFNSVCFPFSAEEETLRTQESHMQDVEKSIQNFPKIQCRGVKGPSVLSDLPNFDMVWSFPFDSMHTWDLGVTHFLCQLLLKTIKKQDRYKLNNLMKSIKPPRTIGTLPKEIFDFNNYKAKDWKAFLLYYCIPIGIHVLPDDIMYLLALLAKSLFILLQRKITEEELNHCEEMLIIFVGNFQKIFTASAMRFNVHMLLHAVDSVRKCGPLWANSTYPYESNIHFIKLLINGARGVDHQIIKKSMNIQTFRMRLTENKTPQSNNKVNIFCGNLFAKSLEYVNNENLNEIVYCDIDNEDENSSLNKTIYKKCIIKKIIYTSIKYTKSKKWNDSYIRLISGENGQIHKIIVDNNQCYFEVKIFDIEKIVINGIEMLHMWKIIREQPTLRIIPISDISCKILYLKGENFDYICKIANNLHNN